MSDRETPPPASVVVRPERERVALSVDGVTYSVVGQLDYGLIGTRYVTPEQDALMSLLGESACRRVYRQQRQSGPTGEFRIRLSREETGQLAELLKHSFIAIGQAR